MLRTTSRAVGTRPAECNAAATIMLPVAKSTISRTACKCERAEQAIKKKEKKPEFIFSSSKLALTFEVVGNIFVFVCALVTEKIQNFRRAS
jgi:hypothetical protein